MPNTCVRESYWQKGFNTSPNALCCSCLGPACRMRRRGLKRPARRGGGIQGQRFQSCSSSPSAEELRGARWGVHYIASSAAER